MLRRSFLAMPIVAAALSPLRLLASERPKRIPIPSDASLTPELLERISDEMLPADHKHAPSEDYQQLLVDLRYREIFTAGDLIPIIAECLPRVLDEESKMIESGAAIGFTMGHKLGRERVRAGVFYIHCGLIRQCLCVKTGTIFVC